MRHVISVMVMGLRIVRVLRNVPNVMVVVLLQRK